MSIDLAAVTAIDTHVHIEADAHGCFALDEELREASAKYFRAGDDRNATLDEVAGYYRVPGDGRGGVHRGRAHRDRP